MTLEELKEKLGKKISDDILRLSISPLDESVRKNLRRNIKLKAELEILERS